MFQSMNEIAQAYNVSAQQIGQVLYILGIRDAEHPVQKGFPFDQYITHGIAQPIENKQGEVRYFHYNIEPVQEEFEKVLKGKAKADVKRQEKRDSGQILREGLTKIEDLISALPNQENQSTFQQLKEELATLQSHLINTDINLALPLDEKAKTLLTQLKQWRKEESLKQDRPAFAIFSNAVLHYLTYYQPHNEEELLGIKGIGEKKAMLYGKALLSLIKNSNPS